MRQSLRQPLLAAMFGIGIGYYAFSEPLRRFAEEIRREQDAAGGLDAWRAAKRREAEAEAAAAAAAAEAAREEERNQKPWRRQRLEQGGGSSSESREQ
ncbi:MAG: hypothetical protein J3K34DRAFT_519943 [Monoraphidium minutum]|nr:MAG: hypothetical protein J3K34DRAFT_519943 [Monoraphidium minutum]